MYRCFTKLNEDLNNPLVIVDLTKNKPWMSKVVSNSQHHHDRALINAIKKSSITVFHLLNLLRCDLFNIWIEPPASVNYITADNDKEYQKHLKYMQKIEIYFTSFSGDLGHYNLHFLIMWSWILTYLLIYSYECISLSWDLGNLFSSTQVRSYSTDQILFFYHSFTILMKSSPSNQTAR